MPKTNIREPLTEVIPVTTKVEVPVLSEAERAELVASFQEAEAEIRDGRTKVMTADEFSERYWKTLEKARAKK